MCGVAGRCMYLNVFVFCTVRLLCFGWVVLVWRVADVAVDAVDGIGCVGSGYTLVECC